MTKEEFKERWELEDDGGLTFEDMGKCAVEWGISSSPRTKNMTKLANQVLMAAGCDPHWGEN